VLLWSVGMTPAAALDAHEGADPCPGEEDAQGGAPADGEGQDRDADGGGHADAGPRGRRVPPLGPGSPGDPPASHPDDHAGDPPGDEDDEAADDPDECEPPPVVEPPVVEPPVVEPPVVGSDEPPVAGDAPSPESPGPAAGIDPPGARDAAEVVPDLPGSPVPVPPAGPEAVTRADAREDSRADAQADPAAGGSVPDAPPAHDGTVYAGSGAPRLATRIGETWYAPGPGEEPLPPLVASVEDPDGPSVATGGPETGAGSGEGTGAGQRAGRQLGADPPALAGPVPAHGEPARTRVAHTVPRPLAGVAWALLLAVGTATAVQVVTRSSGVAGARVDRAGRRGDTG
jgi:hypothetical protein